MQRISCVLRFSIVGRAMGEPEGATLEEVKEYIRLVRKHLQERGSEAVCGCGLLSLQVGRAGFMDRARAEDRSLQVFQPEPEDIDSDLDSTVTSCDTQCPE